MPDIYHNIEDKILEAVKLLNSQGKLNITKAACDFYIFSLKIKNC